ncbi:hypothetical protein PAXRUDRAFT_158618, partial [Paxillus rubicundulus Ve08.2h10]
PLGSSRNSWCKGDSQARSGTVPSARGVQHRPAREMVGANSALCIHTHRDTSTQISNGDESQEGLHTEETIGRWK